MTRPVSSRSRERSVLDPFGIDVTGCFEATGDVCEATPSGTEGVCVGNCKLVQGVAVLSSDVAGPAPVDGISMLLLPGMLLTLCFVLLAVLFFVLFAFAFVFVFVLVAVA